MPFTILPPAPLFDTITESDMPAVVTITAPPGSLFTKIELDWDLTDFVVVGEGAPIAVITINSFKGIFYQYKCTAVKYPEMSLRTVEYKTEGSDTGGKEFKVAEDELLIEYKRISPGVIKGSISVESMIPPPIGTTFSGKYPINLRCDYGKHGEIIKNATDH